MDTIDMSWADRSSCAPENKTGLDFFGKLTPAIEELCANCPVRVQCLDHALRKEQFGIWAGTTEEERVMMRRERGLDQVYFDRSLHRRFKEARKRKYEQFPIEHGTEKGYQLHTKRGWDFFDDNGNPCECKEAHRAYIKAYRKKKKEQAA